MSKNEEKEGKQNSKSQRRDNKLTKVNKKQGNENERPSSEEGKPDISKTFPNFSALTETERLIFFQALTTARKNVEERGVPTRQCFGTVHDEYLKYFTQDQKEREEVFENAKETSYLTSTLIIRDDNTSSCINESNLKLSPRNFSDEKSRSTKIRVTNARDKKQLAKEPGFWDPCESVVQRNTNKMIDLYLRKKKRMETKSSNVKLTDEKPVKSKRSKTPQLDSKRNFEPGRKKTESFGTSTMAKTTLKVRNTSRFDALNAEEREIFFRTLQKAHDNIIERNPEKEGEILPLDVIMEKYQADRQAMAVFTTSQEPRRREEGRRNLRVKVILTSGDNERLSKTKSQVLSDAMREVNDRRHKSAESLQAEGKETSGAVETHDQEDQSESSFCNIGKISRDSLEIYEKNASKLNKQKETVKFEEIKPNETIKCEEIKPNETIKCEETKSNEITECEEIKPNEKNFEENLKGRTKEKKKIKRKEKKLSNPKKLKKPPVPTNEPKTTETLKVNELDILAISTEKKGIKDIKKGFAVQKKKHSKKEMQKMKKEQEKKEQQKKEELLKKDPLLESKNLPPSENIDQNLKEPEGLELVKEQCHIKEKECQVIDTKEVQENCEIETSETEATSTAVNASEENCEETWWQLENEQNEETVKDIGNNDESTSEEEKHAVECIIAPEIENEGGVEAETFEQNEKSALEINLGSLKSVTAEESALLDSDLSIKEEIALLDSNLSIKEESAIAVKSLLIIDNNDCEAERTKGDSESDEENPEPLIMETQREITAEASMLQEVFKKKCFKEERPREERETKKIAPDFAPGKVMFVDDNEIEKVKKLISYLEEKVQKDDHLEKEYLQLLVDYVDYLSKVLESLVVRDERHHKQVHETYTAPEIHLKFDDAKTQSQKKDSIPHSASNEELSRVHSEGSIREAKAGKSEEKRSSRKSETEVPMTAESESSSDSEMEVRFTPINTNDQKIRTTNIRLLQDLLHQRAEFVEGSIADFKIVHHSEAEDFVPAVQEKPQTVFLTDEDEENNQEGRKTKFFKALLKFCLCGRSKTEEDGMFENLKGEVVRTDVYDTNKVDPASVTLNQSTMEVLKAAERKKIIDKYYSQD